MLYKLKRNGLKWSVYFLQITHNFDVICGFFCCFVKEDHAFMCKPVGWSDPVTKQMH